MKPAKPVLVLALIVLAACGGASSLGDGPSAGATTGGADAGAGSSSAGPHGADAGSSLDSGATTGADAADTGARDDGDGGDPYEPTSATAYLVNPAHTGAIDDPTLTLPLARQWNRDLGDATSYPLIVHGIVYVIVGPQSAAGGLTALDAKTGATLWGPIDLGDSTSGLGGASLAYDGGLVFAINATGFMQAFDAGTGAVRWTSQMPDQMYFSSPLTAYRGMVYTGGSESGGTAYGVSETDGSVVWTADVANGEDSSPAVSDDGVFVSYACIQAYAFDRVTGAQLWWHDGPCEGGGGATPVLFGGDLYAMDSTNGNLILDAKTGAVQGTFTSDVPPAFESHLGFFVSGGGVHASDVATRASAWVFPGDGEVSTSPVVAAGHVFVGSQTSMLFGIDEETGTMAWSDDLSDTVVSVGFDTIGVMAAAEGVLIVPSGTHLVAYAHSDDADAGAGDGGDADASSQDAEATAPDGGPDGVADTAPIVEVAAGLEFACARRTDGTVDCWGDNSYGECGVDHPFGTTHVSRPVQVTGIASAIQIAAGETHACALLAGGTVSCWGDDSSGELGNGKKDTITWQPVSVTGLSNVVEIAATKAATCAVTGDGSLWCWGYDLYGMLGQPENPGGLETDFVVPTMVPSLTGIVDVAMSETHTCVRDATGAVRCFGDDQEDELGFVGVGGPTPVPVAGVNGALQASCSISDTCVRLGDGTVSCFGANGAGQLGTGTTSATLSPTPSTIASVSDVVEIRSGLSHTCARSSVGDAWCWGSNVDEQVAPSATCFQDCPTPIAVAGLHDVQELAAGSDFTCALVSGGVVECWGAGDSGQLGDGLDTNHSAPTSVTF